MTSLSRRAAIVGALVSSTAAAVAAAPAVASDPDAAIMALAVQWVGLNDAASDKADAHADDMAYDIQDEPEAIAAAELERQLRAMPAATPKGSLIKILVVSAFGDFFAPEDLVGEALRLTGFTPYRDHPRHPDYRRNRSA